MACINHSIEESIRGEQTELDLDSRNRMHSECLADRGGAHFTQTDTADLSLSDKLRQGLNGCLDGDLRINSSQFKDIDGLCATENPKGFVDGCADTLGTSVWAAPHVVCALDAQVDFLGILGVLVKVVFDEMQRVGLGGAVMDALLGVSGAGG